VAAGLLRIPLGAVVCGRVWRAEAKSFIFLVVKGSVELRVTKKRKGFSGWVLLGARCVAWLLSLVEEVLRNPGFEDFVKSFMEGSKVTIIRRGGNNSCRFLEVVVYAVGGQRGMIVFPEGCDGWGWGRVSRELSKVLAFFESMVASSSSSGVSVGKSLGKVVGGLSFAVCRDGALVG
jgi:hypothetical protein